MNSTSPSRITSFDAARGTAMLLVCVAHFLEVYYFQNRLHPAEGAKIGALGESLLFISRLATPTFFLLSGLMVGYLYRTMDHQFNALRLRLIDKALFLLTIGHVLISLFTAVQSSGFSHSIMLGYATDTLALCVIGSLLLLPRTTTTTRVWLGFTLYLVSWTGWYVWTPDTSALNGLKSIFLGPQNDGTIIFYFPLLPWFGVHLIGGCIGEHLSQYRGDDLYRQGSKRLGIIAAAAVLVALATKMIFETLAALDFFTPTASLYPFIAPLQKYPPGPLYLLLMGGGALLLVSGLLFSKTTQCFPSAMRLVATVGRNSLLVFLLQYFVYYAVFYVLVAKTNLIAPWIAVGALLLSLLGILAVTIWLDKHHIRRVWTVGLSPLKNL